MSDTNATQMGTTNIVFVLFDGVTQLDFSGPVQFLSRLPGAKTYVAAKTLDPVETDSSFAIVPNINFADCPQADIICIPGGHGVTEAIADKAVTGFVEAQALGAQWITSVCTGALILGAAGLIDGKHATTHWAYTHLLPLFGAVHEPGRVVRDGNVVTAGGVTSGIDFSLELIALVAGEDIARAIQLSLEYDPAPPFVGGNPATSPAHIVDRLKTLVYDKRAAEMEIAIRDIL